MKKLTAILAVALIAGSAAFAQTNQVLSRNAVGYVKVSLDSNKLYLVSNPFVNLESSEDPYLTNVFSTLPAGSSVSIWQEEGIPGYKTYTRGRAGWAGDALTARVERADGAFVRMPSSGTADLFLMGEVPDRFTAPSSYVARIAGITMVGLPYPVTVRLTNTVMAQELPAGTSLSVWDPNLGVSGGYVTYTKGRAGWAGAALTAEIQPGQGLVIRTTEPADDWYETKPYTWP